MPSVETAGSGASDRPARSVPVVPLTDCYELGVPEIGGKAASLARLVQAGFRVPDAVVLTTAFFASWWQELRATADWARFEQADAAACVQHAAALAARVEDLACSVEMRAGLDEVRERLPSWGTGATCAVRSSSPDEDLEAASFAGGYVTRLGVTAEGLEAAVRACFASCLAERVLVYKAQHGLDVHAPRIAVVIQQQLASEVAGVGFSLNPVTNDFDEAVIDANFGLGESVVAGEVSPDHFVVEKPGEKILERTLGAKAISYRLQPEGGIERLDEERGTEASLSDDQVLELSRMLGQVETLYGLPIDLEWAYADGELHLLQARPITAYFPLSLEMQTQPGAPRRLYADGNLSDGITSNRPITELTLDGYRIVMAQLFENYGIAWDSEEKPLEDLLVFRGARMYAALSDIFWFMSPQVMAAQATIMDILLYRTLINVNRDDYKPKQKPDWLSWRGVARAAFGVLWGFRRQAWRTGIAMVAPERYLKRYKREAERFEAEARSTPPDASVAELLALHERAMKTLMDSDMPTIIGWMGAVGILGALSSRADPQTQQLLDRMGRGFDGELVIEMGVEMFAASRLLDAVEFDDLPRLAKRVEARELPAAFLAAWDGLIHRYGARGPNEMELASPRYGEDPRLLLRQLSFMAKAPPESDPKLAHEQHVAARPLAFAELSKQVGWFRRALLRRAHRWTDAYASERDTAKYHWVLGTYPMRRGALLRGERLEAAGRLDSRDDVFHLTLDELEGSDRDASFDVRTPARERRQFIEKLDRQVKEFPHLVDSRGRILRPAATHEADGLTGMGISPGVASGPIKVLENPYDKEVEPGDVLVAYTTDPGWTPLFINASAIILQVGGMMQHGGVVAREYGKPCVAGIQHVLTRFEDGQWVEVDGFTGVVRVLDEAD